MPYQTNYKSGAQKGLEMKMDFWKEDKIKTEYNIATAQCLNLVQERYGVELPDKETIMSLSLYYFKILMEIRSSKDFRDVFESYIKSYAKVETKPEAAQQTVTEPY